MDHVAQKEWYEFFITYSAKKAEKDECKRKRDIIRLQEQIECGEFSASCNMLTTCNKYMKFDEKGVPAFNYEEFICNKMKDGLRGYVTNIKTGEGEAIAMYRRFVRIWKKFRLLENDLQAGCEFEDLPKIRRRIEARLCITFTAYQVYKEFERVLKTERIVLSPEKSVELVLRSGKLIVFPEKRLDQEV